MDYYKCDYDIINKFLEKAFSSVYLIANASDSWKIFRTAVSQAIYYFVPIKSFKFSRYKTFDCRARKHYNKMHKFYLKYKQRFFYRGRRGRNSPWPEFFPPGIGSGYHRAWSINAKT